MSDPVAAPAVEAKPDSLAHIKQSMLSNLNAAYGAFVGQVKMLPIHQGLMQTAFNHLDTGLIWLEKAISIMEALPLPPKVEEVAAVAGEVLEGVEKAVEAIEPPAEPAPAV